MTPRLVPSVLVPPLVPSVLDFMLRIQIYKYINLNLHIWKFSNIALWKTVQQFTVIVTGQYFPQKTIQIEVS